MYAVKSYNNLYEKMLDEANLRGAFFDAAFRKTTRKDIKRILDNLDFHVEHLRDVLLNTAAGKDGAEVNEKVFAPVKRKGQSIFQTSNNKVRVIRKPGYQYEQVVHHAVMRVIMPIFRRGMYEYCCGSVPGRGPHYGKKYIESIRRKDIKRMKYCAVLDIKQFYASISQDALKDMLRKKIRDRRMLHLLFLIIESCDDGIPLGYYTSQWFANFYLQGLDHHIKETLKVKYYIRYLDDLVLFGNNKKELHKAVREIIRYVSEELRLTIKENWQVFRFDYIKEFEISCDDREPLADLWRTLKEQKIKREYRKRNGAPVIVVDRMAFNKHRETILPDGHGFNVEEIHYGRALDFMGFVFYCDRTVIRERILLRATRKIRKVKKKGRITWLDASAILSYIGWFSHTDSYGAYLKHVKPYVKVQDLKRCVSRRARRLNKDAKRKLAVSRRHSNKKANGG